MSKLLSRPWFLAALALLILVGTQAGAFYLYWDELFPAHRDVLLIKREQESELKWNFSSADIENLKEELEDRLRRIESKEVTLREYEARLEADRAEIEEIKRNIERMRSTLFANVTQVEEWEQKNLKNLAATYSDLEPTATVSIFEELDDRTVAKILHFMKPDAVGEILEQMVVKDGGNEALIKRAARLSDILRLFSDETITKR